MRIIRFLFFTIILIMPFISKANDAIAIRENIVDIEQKEAIIADNDSTVRAEQSVAKTDQIENVKTEQNDVFITGEVETVVSKKKAKNPVLASTLSAVLPGAGQVYNGRWWEVPVIYGGGAVLYYFYSTNNKEYKIYRNEYIARVHKDTAAMNPILGVFTAENIKEIKNYYQRNIELVYLLSGLLYVLNILDACVFAHLSTFDVSDDLSLKITPSLTPNYYANSGYNAGISLKFTFK